MSFLRLAIVKNCGAIRNSLAPLSGTLNISSINVNRFVIPAISNSTRSLSLTVPKYCDANATDEPEVEKKKSHRYDKPNRDRSKIIPVETSIEYLTSDAYKETYGERKIYDGYRRVHKGSIAPRKTRESCIRFNVVTTSSPCPICRDEYLVLDHKNLDLIKQFISPHSGEVSCNKFTYFS